MFDEERFRYGPPSYLVASMDLPIVAEVLEASTEVPNSCRIEFNQSQMLERAQGELQLTNGLRDNRGS
ncbi:AraC family transcriptional regulator N-terminal domain-containing protein [Clostridium aminobutyricum]|uniref:AraC family transcriptional regulator N-terminal domain-containing protein n=1 Tax=Clostridium aminobutyricum TaxID=33953 RepID=A0A939IIM4_CLOAM|nr:AraC family transcriptional regulator N-terminal domain-containing protein [Clostridium aminobutyricum]